MDDRDLYIPKSATMVELRDHEGALHRCKVFLQEAVKAGDRGERLQDVLANRRFLPIQHEGGVRFVSNRHVLWVRVDLLAALDELDPEAEGGEGSASAHVSLALDDASHLDGTLRYFLPRTGRRVGDYLNTLAPFFPLRTDDFLYLVNRERVVGVVPLSEKIEDRT